MIDVSGVSKELLDEIRIHFEATPEVQRLRVKQQYAQRTGNLQEALDIAKRLESLFSEVLYNYISESNEQVKVLDSETSDIPDEDKDAMMGKLMVLFMACDIIESAVNDLQDILHRSKPDFHITTFDDIYRLSKLSKEKLKYLQEKGDYMKDLAWADGCDNMYDMMQSKARSIIRKRRESKNWGENMKKFEK